MNRLIIGKIQELIDAKIAEERSLSSSDGGLTESLVTREIEKELNGLIDDYYERRKNDH